MKQLLFTTIFIISAIHFFAQSPCATDEIHATLLKKDSHYANRHHDINDRIYQKIKEGNIELRSNYTIPVVIHIITPPGTPVGSGNNITNEEVLAGLELLNQAYANSGSFVAPDGVDIGIRFCLAKRTPEGNATNGITRHESYLVADNFCDPYGTAKSSDLDIKKIVSWNCQEYLNFWLVTDLHGPDDCLLLGYAYYPGVGCDKDGIVMEALNWANNKGAETAAHEVGHYLNLFHTFEEGCFNLDCLLYGDKVCDTPPDDSEDFADCNTNSCSSDSPDRPDDNTNFMDYSSCQPVHFTNGQRERMIAALTEARPGLLTSQGCVPVHFLEVSANRLDLIGGGCSSELCPVLTTQNNGSDNITSMTIQVQVNGSILLEFVWEGSIVTDQSVEIKIPCFTLEPGSHDITLRVLDVNETNDELPGNNFVSRNNVEVYPLPELNFQLIDSAFCGQNGIVQLSASNGTAPYSYMIDGETAFQTEDKLDKLADKTYTIITSDFNDCRDTINMTIPGYCPPCLSDVFIPNVFSPNYDGINDNFEIQFSLSKIEEMRIFNRWGIVVYATKNENPKWDGTYRGQLVKSGVYIYQVKGKCADGTPFVTSGSVNIMR